MLLRRLPLSFVLPLSRLLLLVATALLSGCYGDTHCTERSEYVACVNHLEGRQDLTNALDTTTPCQASEVKYVPIGSEETLECRVLRNVQVDFLGWHFYPSDSTRDMVIDINLNPSPLTSRFMNETDRLTIRNIELGDEGVYVCEAKEGTDQTRMVIAGCVIVHATVPSYTDGSVSLLTTRGKDVTLMTKIIFENSGFCNITPTYSQARLRYEPNANVLFLCQNQSCVIDDGQSFYNFSSLGDVVVRASHVMDGPYLMAIIQDCPSTVLRMTYDIAFTSHIPTTTMAIAPTTKIEAVSSTIVPTDPTVATAPSRPKKDDSSSVIIGILVPFVAVFLAVAVAVSLYIIYKHRQQTFKSFPETETKNKDPLYEEPNGVVNGTHLQREDSLYSGHFAPSTIGGEKPGMGPYDIEDVHLNEKPTDESATV